MEHLEKSKEITIRCSETILECSLCMEQFVSPRILPCQHTFCRECLMELISTNCLNANGSVKQRSFPCPICRKDCKLKRGENISMEEHLKAFPENLLMVNLLDARKTTVDEGLLNERQVENENEEDNFEKDFRRCMLFMALKHYLDIMSTIYVYLDGLILCTPKEHFLNQNANSNLALRLRLGLSQMLTMPAKPVNDNDIEECISALVEIKHAFLGKIYAVDYLFTGGVADIKRMESAFSKDWYMFVGKQDVAVQTKDPFENYQRSLIFLMCTFGSAIIIMLAIYFSTLA